MCPMYKHLSAWLESIAPQWGQHVLNLRCCKKSRCGYLPWKTDFWTPLVSAKCRVISAFALAGCGGAQWGRQVTCFLTDRAESAREENSFSVALMKMCHQARTSLYRKGRPDVIVQIQTPQARPELGTTYGFSVWAVTKDLPVEAFGDQAPQKKVGKQANFCSTSRGSPSRKTWHTSRFQAAVNKP